ncbi:hydroxyacylglutathione hydrolase [Parasulfitobacter algicola]|uniref:Hydroxyacylglutathione hydrolase n=1 Tax=Parasulfitobacter algicola TaxID=2614809 RepID=A0ABX2IUV3_9RHOB|nr:hydroxyacylglutathione hydrolase [Sulfitobacter algicola]NSX54835.1 hydroxyacylglutathione hydrolase [Sulfitobacter algicola]
MPLEIITIPCRTDNYAFLVHNSDSGETALVDAPEFEPIKDVLDQNEWQLTDLLITHHHFDHIDAVAQLRDSYAPRVIGAKADAARLPDLDVQVADGDTLIVCGAECHVMDVPGHTVGHIAFHMPSTKAVFTADSLMALGCGRLFEGTPDQMWNSLCKIRALPADTLVYSGHEYTASNAKFALTIEPENNDLISRFRQIEIARKNNTPTVPSRLSDECLTNPFLRADLADVKSAIHMDGKSDEEVFAEIRKRKDNF